MEKQRHFYVLVIWLVFASPCVISQEIVVLNHYQADELKVSELASLTIRSGESVQLGGEEIVSGGTSPYIFYWEPATGLDYNNVAIPVAAPEKTSIYTLTVSDANGCQIITEQEVIVSQISGVSESQSEENIRIFPNPGDGLLVIEGRNTTSLGKLGIRIFSLDGKQIFEEESVLDADSFIREIDLRDQPCGSYIAEIRIKQNMIIRSIIIQ